MLNSPLLKLDGLNVAYDAIKAVRDADLQVTKGEVVALLGANGAGKSSLLNAIMGLAPKTAGTVFFKGQKIDKSTPELIAASGLTLVFEGRRVFPKLTVRENLMLGSVAGRGRVDVNAKLEEIETQFPILNDRQNQRAGTLSGGEQQMLAIARALMSAPEMILLDEPSLGLAPKIVDDVFVMIERLKSQGVTLLLVEQNVEMALEVADRGYLMHSSVLGKSSTIKELQASTMGIDAFVGA